jgi:hypothetical protein
MDSISTFEGFCREEDNSGRMRRRTISRAARLNRRSHSNDAGSNIDMVPLLSAVHIKSSQDILAFVHRYSIGVQSAVAGSREGSVRVRVRESFGNL